MFVSDVQGMEDLTNPSGKLSRMQGGLQCRRKKVEEMCLDACVCDNRRENRNWRQTINVGVLTKKASLAVWSCLTWREIAVTLLAL